MNYKVKQRFSKDILDEIEYAKGKVKVLLKSGESLIGRGDCMDYDEDENGFETIKNLLFRKDDGDYIYIYPDDVDSYEIIS